MVRGNHVEAGGRISPWTLGAFIGSPQASLPYSRVVPLPSIEASVLRVDDDGVTLLGGWSPSSGLRHFPRSTLCPYSGADDVEPVDLPRTGTVWLRTTVNLPPPGYRGPVPYHLGIVELDGTPLLRVIGRLAGTKIDPGDRVTLDGDEVPDADGDPVLTWVFRSS
jgi:uncharacterized OB-fold protein